MPNQTLPPVRRALCFTLPALAVFLLLAPLPASAHPAPQAASSTIDTSDRSAVAAAYRDVYLPAIAAHAPAPTAQDIADCTAGSTPDELQDATLRLVNYVRAMSQVPPVTFDPALSDKAQHAALMMYANDALDHDPPSSWNCYSTEGADAAAHSNLGLGYAGADVVAGYLGDSGDTNTEAGHRWWLQRPTTQVMGNGTFGTANALWVSPVDDATATGEPGFTSWPSDGYFPAPLEPAGRWSFSPNDPTADLTAATVSVRKGDGTPVAVTRQPLGRFASLVFEVGHLAAPTGSEVDSYDVTVSGVRIGGQPMDPYRYTVRLVDPSLPVPVPPLSAVTPAVVTGSTVVGSTLRARPPQWSASGVTTSYRWLCDGRPIAGATTPTYLLATADIGHRISVEVTGSSPAEEAVSTSVPTARVTKVPSVLSLTATSPAVGRVRLAVRLTARGAGVTGAVRVRDGVKTVASALKVVRGAAVYSAKAKPGRHTYTVTYAGSARVASSRRSVPVTVRGSRATAP